MPYTFAHPGFLLPLHKKWPHYFSLSAIVAGSIVPDLDILFRLTNPRFHLFHFTVPEFTFLLWPLAIIFTYYIELVLNKFYIGEPPEIAPLPILICSFVSIAVHIFLDACVHLDAYQNSLQIFRLFGADKADHLLLFQTSILIVQYLPQLLITIAGFWMLFSLGKIYVIKTMAAIVKPRFLKIAIPFSILFFAVKYFLTIQENQYRFDNIILMITASILVTFFCNTTFHYFRKAITQTDGGNRAIRCNLFLLLSVLA